MNISEGLFYFISDEYFDDFKDARLMRNKEACHSRPCCFSFFDKETNLMWMVPVSSRVEKYRRIAQNKAAKYGRCDTILFGTMLNHERAFLLQNMCPITEAYVDNQYVDSNGYPIKINYSFEKTLKATAIRILRLQRKGVNIIMPDVLSIEKALLKKKLGVPFCEVLLFFTQHIRLRGSPNRY